jgi:hypothetical protein
VACAVPVLLLAWLPQVLTRDLLTFLFFEPWGQVLNYQVSSVTLLS